VSGPEKLLYGLRWMCRFEIATGTERPDPDAPAPELPAPGHAAGLRRGDGPLPAAAAWAAAVMS
jgi:hypothetical protein